MALHRAKAEDHRAASICATILNVHRKPGTPAVTPESLMRKPDDPGAVPDDQKVPVDLLKPMFEQMAVEKGRKLSA